MSAVSVHTANHLVKGKARQYRYYCASLFRPYETRDGRMVWHNVGIHTKPRRSLRLAERDAEGLAAVYDAMLYYGCASLHNQPAPMPAGGEW